MRAPLAVGTPALPCKADHQWQTVQDGERQNEELRALRGNAGRARPTLSGAR